MQCCLWASGVALLRGVDRMVRVGAKTKGLDKIQPFYR